MAFQKTVPSAQHTDEGSNNSPWRVATVAASRVQGAKPPAIGDLQGAESPHKLAVCAHTTATASGPRCHPPSPRRSGESPAHPGISATTPVWQSVNVLGAAAYLGLEFCISPACVKAPCPKHTLQSASCVKHVCSSYNRGILFGRRLQRLSHVIGKCWFRQV